MKLPKHIGIILDGNGRWAKSRGKARIEGHKQGLKTLEKVVEHASELNIKYLTVYAFSTENWNRPEAEVNFLMTTFEKYLKDAIKKSNDRDVKFNILGSRDRLTESAVKLIDELEEKTKNKTGITFNVAVNYGGRDEIVRAIKKIDTSDIDGLTIDEFSNYLDTAGMPDPDLIIRTSGECRVSGFLLWQLAYAEFYFTDIHWPDFDKEELIKAIDSYSKRDRRMGSIK
ncbi:MAG: isoprenyl transferase [Clostridia bacterium]|nr:isoprenyl transferase [Clostridia bacterium]